MKEFLVYSLARAGLFFACYAVTGSLWFVFRGVEGILFVPALIAIVVSVSLSWPLLRGPRERFAQVVQGRAEKASERFEEMRAKEDVD